MAFFSERNTFRFIVAALIIGTLYRLYPVFSGPAQLAQFFMTEDGYLMLTIARNMAIGLGMSVSEGTIPSNGVQPLATFLFAIPYYLTGGDKETSLIGVHLIATAISVAGIFSVRALAQMVLKQLDPSPVWPWFVATLWFVGPLLVLHSMNGLETGLYTLMVTLTLVLFGKLLCKGVQAGFADRMVLGAACGVTFLARNDGAFLVAGIFLVWMLHELFVRRDGFLAVVGRLFPPGAISLVVASPWLIFNYINFGSIVPISGTAQALSGGFAKNATALPAKLFEFSFPMLPVPTWPENTVWFTAVATVLVLALLLVFLMNTLRQPGVDRHVISAYALFVLALSSYYGFYFGAGWFLGRYLAPSAPFLSLAMTYCVLLFVRQSFGKYGVAIQHVMAFSGLIISLGVLVWMMTPGARDQGHFQIVDWVEQNIDDTTWIGAVQSGTLGYWHDRTINLDGKVNPEALAETLAKGNVYDYVLASKVTYLVDWWGMVTWMQPDRAGSQEFVAAFEVLVEDKALNLGVLKRR